MTNSSSTRTRSARQLPSPASSIPRAMRARSSHAGGPCRRRARRGHLGGGRDLDARLTRALPEAGPQPVVPGHRRRLRGDVDEGMSGAPATPRTGNALGRHLGSHSVRRRELGVRPVLPDGHVPELLEGAEPRHACPTKPWPLSPKGPTTRPSPVTLAVVFHMGGAINRVGSADTAYGERTAQCDVVLRRQLGGPRGQRRQHRLGARRLRSSSRGTARAAPTPTSPARPTRLPTRWPGTLWGEHGAAPGDQEAVRPRQLLPHQPEHPSGVARNRHSRQSRFAGSEPLGVRRLCSLESAEAVVARDGRAVHAQRVFGRHSRHRVQQAPVVPDEHVGRLPVMEVAEVLRRLDDLVAHCGEECVAVGGPLDPRCPCAIQPETCSTFWPEGRVQTAGWSARGRPSYSVITSTALGAGSTSTKSSGRPNRRFSMITSIA